MKLNKVIQFKFPDEYEAIFADAEGAGESEGLTKKSEAKVEAASPQEANSGKGKDAGPQPSMFQMFLPFIAIAMIFYFLIIRPESRRRKEREQKLGQLKLKDKVATIGGIIGTIVELNADEVVLQIDPKKDVKMRFRRSAIEGALVSGQEQK